MSFPKATCAQCTRQLSRLARSSKSSSNTIPRQAVPQPSYDYAPLPVTRRLYSTASSRRVGRVLQTPDAFAKVRFTRADVPPLQFWARQARALQVTDLSADECLQAAQAYADAALKNAPGWRERLITTGDISAQTPASQGRGMSNALSAYTLHYIAVMIVLSQPTGQTGHLATHILHTLTGLDYVPSILTLVCVALKRRRLDQPQFEPAVQGLERTLRRIGDGKSNKSTSKSSDFAADACTLRAMIYAAEGTREGDDNALRWFRRAFEMGIATSGPSASSTASQALSERQPEGEVSADKDSDVVKGLSLIPGWQWKVSFALGVAAIRMKRGELEMARVLYTFASSQLDNADGYFSMANLLEKLGEAKTDKYLECLETAAVSGVQEAARKMGTREWDRAAEAGLSKWEKRKRQVVAEEWMAIAGTTVPSEA